MAKRPWVFPTWMQAHLHLIDGVGGDARWVEELVNDHTTTTFENAPRALMCVSVKAQVQLLERLRAERKL